MISTIRALPESKLINLVKYYQNLSISQKSHIIYIAIKNTLPSEIEMRTTWNDLLNRVYIKLNDISFENIIYDFLKQNINDLDVLIDIQIYDIESLLICLKQYQYLSDKYSMALYSLFINYLLHKQGYCPMLFYSFGTWKTIKNEQDIRLLIELSLTYLYRFIEVVTPKDIGKDYQLLSEGATSIVYLCFGGRTICKIPKNFIAADLLIKQEYENYLYLSNTCLKKYIASNYVYDSEKNRLYHENIIGVTGEAMLFNHILFSAEQIKSLEYFYLLYSSRLDKELILDIHPGNFIWDELKECWCLVDIGTIPKIGSDYYDFENFKSYFKYVWEDREELMRVVPIRSVDLCLSSVSVKLSDENVSEKGFL